MAHCFAENFDGWYAYAERYRNRPPRPLLTRAVAILEHKDTAIDIGSGGLNDTGYLLEAGFAHVTALDAEPIAQAVADTLPHDRFRYHIEKIEDFAAPEASFDLVSAQYALPFVDPRSLNAVIDRLRRALRPGGIFTGQFFGNWDDWAGTAAMSFHTEIQARALLDGLTLLEWTEEDDPGSQTLSGQPKHWHLFHFIARNDRPAPTFL